MNVFPLTTMSISTGAASARSACLFFVSTNGSDSGSGSTPADAFATVDDGEIWLRNLHIPEYHHGTWTNHAPRRNRKLLLHRRQIDMLVGKIRDGNLTLVPLSLYFIDGKVKVEIALARGKQAHDKRQDIARRDAQREVVRELGRRAKGMS